jgi:tetratricopeptide (TPR) repeat protein
VALLLVAAIAIIGAATSGGDKTADTTKPRGTPRAQTTPKATATATATATQAPAQTQSTPAPSGDPAQLNNQGFALFRQGRFGEAVPYFQKAVEGCGSSTAVNPCAYATYNLGAALNRSGHPDQAIPVLQQELDRWPDNQPGTVHRELKAACKATGQKCNQGGGGNQDGGD